MEDEWIVQNNSGTVLILPKNKLKFTNGGKMDLVKQLGLSVKEIELDREIKRELTYNNLVTIKKTDSSKENEAELSKKMDAMINLLQQGGAQAPPAPVSEPQNPREQIVEMMLKEGSLEGILDKYFKDKTFETGTSDKTFETGENLEEILDKYFKNRTFATGEGKVVKDDEEEKMREDAIKQLIDRDKKPQGSLDDFGDKRVSGEDEDFSDLIDF